jgi:hypothetical protein
MCVFISVEELFLLKRKKGFPFVSLRSENNLIEAKRNIGSEKKQKNRTEFFKWTSETHAIRIRFRFISLIFKRNGRTLVPTAKKFSPGQFSFYFSLFSLSMYNIPYISIADVSKCSWRGRGIFNMPTLLTFLQCFPFIKFCYRTPLLPEEVYFKCVNG